MVLFIAYLLAYLISILVVVISGIYLFFKYRYQYWDKRGVPAASASLIFGSIKESTLLRITGAEELAVWYKKYKEEGHKFYGGFLFHQPFLVAIDPGFIRNVMAKDFNHFVDHGGYVNEEDDPLSATLFALSGTKWRHLRQKLTPTFTSGKLKMMFQTLVACTEELKGCLDDSVSQNLAVDIKKVLSQYTIDVIGSCAFGLDCNSFKDPNSEFIRHGSIAFNPKLVDRIRLFFAFLFPTFAKFLKIKITNKEIDQFFRKLVKDTVEYRERNNVVRKDFMHLLIQLKNKGVVDDEEGQQQEQDPELIGTTLTIEEICAQAFIFFLAGFETSSTTMTFALYELAENIGVQEKLRKEIKSVIDKHEGNLTYAAVKDMHYLDRVVSGKKLFYLEPFLPCLAFILSLNSQLYRT